MPGSPGNPGNRDRQIEALLGHLQPQLREPSGPDSPTSLVREMIKARVAALETERSLLKDQLWEAVGKAVNEMLLTTISSLDSHSGQLKGRPALALPQKRPALDGPLSADATRLRDEFRGLLDSDKLQKERDALLPRISQLQE